MKLSCASSAFDRMLVAGDLTQLEFIESCARELACDGVVLDVRHFPRTDDDYLAQIKKMAADLGLDVAAIRDDEFFFAPDDAMAATVRLARLTGAPLVTSQLARETALPWSDQLARISAATGLAKAENVTLALRNAPHTFAATTADCKRVLKESDSAWMRLGLEPHAFDATSDPASLAPNVVLLWQAAELPIADVCDLFPTFRAHLTLDAPGTLTTPTAKANIQAHRNALAHRTIGLKT